MCHQNTGGEKMPEGTPDEIAAAIKMEAIARGNHDRKRVAELRKEKGKGKDDSKEKDSKEKDSKKKK